MGGKWRQTSNCHLSYIGVCFVFFLPNFIFVSQDSRKHHTFYKKKKIKIPFSRFRENVKCYWIPNKDVKKGDTVTYLRSNNVTALHSSSVSLHCSIHLVNSQRTKFKIYCLQSSSTIKLNWINKNTEEERFRFPIPSSVINFSQAVSSLLNQHGQHNSHNVSWYNTLAWQNIYMCMYISNILWIQHFFLHF